MGILIIALVIAALVVIGALWYTGRLDGAKAAAASFVALVVAAVTETWDAIVAAFNSIVG